MLLWLFSEENAIQSQPALPCWCLYKGWSSQAIYANTDEMLEATILDKTQTGRSPKSRTFQSSTGQTKCRIILEEILHDSWSIFIAIVSCSVKEFPTCGCFSSAFKCLWFSFRKVMILQLFPLNSHLMPWCCTVGLKGCVPIVLKFCACCLMPEVKG